MCGEIGTIIHYGGHVKWQSPLGKLYAAPQKLKKIEWPYYSATLLLGIYSKET